MKLFDRDMLFAELRRRELGAWADSLEQTCRERFAPDAHGTLPQWIQAWEDLPHPNEVQPIIDATGDVVAVQSPHNSPRANLRQTLMKFHPWRKGPFEFFGVEIDTEWRSDLKWNRLADAIDLHGKTILDIGCGNGYYGWKMLDAGADLVVGLDPFLLYVMQFEATRRFVTGPERHFVVPIGDTELPHRLNAFDVAFSMGVLYHRTSPIDHLQTIRSTLRPGGQVVLETLVVESSEPEVLVPAGRYAKMRNVWFIPSVPMLERWLHRTGFRDIAVVDVSATTVEEQRQTDWMTFESLSDFLDPVDPTKTIEGYPGPVRALLIATCAG